MDREKCCKNPPTFNFFDVESRTSEMSFFSLELFDFFQKPFHKGFSWASAIHAYKDKSSKRVIDWIIFLVQEFLKV